MITGSHGALGRSMLWRLAARRVTVSRVCPPSEVFQQPGRLGGAVVRDEQVVMVETGHDIAAKPFTGQHRGDD